MSGHDLEAPRTTATRSIRRPSPWKLGVTLITFPGDHIGFLGGEYGMTGVPHAFAVTLRQVLDD